MKLKTKVIGFSMAAIVMSLAFTGITNWIVYNFLDVVGIPEYGQFLLFQIALALVETVTCLVVIDDVADELGLVDEIEEALERRQIFGKL